MNKAVFIDAGHGGIDPGCPLYKGEKHYNMEVAQKLADMLWARGYEVGMARSGDRSMSLKERTQRANAFYQGNGGLFVSIHHNAAGNPGAEGMEVYHAKNSQWGYMLAKNIGTGQKTYLYEWPHTWRGEKQGHFYVLTHTKAPAVLVECEFMTAPDFRKIACDSQSEDTWAMHMAKVILRGIELTVKE